jgi:hypothetical protein
VTLLGAGSEESAGAGAVFLERTSASASAGAKSAKKLGLNNQGVCTWVGLARPIKLCIDAVLLTLPACWRGLS